MGDDEDRKERARPQGEVSSANVTLAIFVRPAAQRKIKRTIFESVIGSKF